ncbi:MAG: hypothetical protein Q8N94_05430 [Methanoregula sp.]|nr:hypothetical protein [Methanoregula sp.]
MKASAFRTFWGYPVITWDLDKYIAIMIGKEILQIGTGTTGAGNTRPNRTPGNSSGTCPVTEWRQGKYYLYGLRFPLQRGGPVPENPVKPFVSVRVETEALLRSDCQNTGGMPLVHRSPKPF